MSSTQSRRHSRNSLKSQLNDPLVEFEAFKKKFLLANKHITKLNSTLSIRIEELNAQISALYAENLRLRASEIALTAQLRKEREKTRVVLVDAESATAGLAKHLSLLRKSFHIPHGSPPPPLSLSKAHRPTGNLSNAFGTTPVAPQPRLAQPPEFPGIEEASEDDDDTLVPGSIVRNKSRWPGSHPMASTSRLPPEEKDAFVGRRKLSKRPSGLIHNSVRRDELFPRAGSPVPAGSPSLRENVLARNGDDDEGEEEQEGDEDLTVTSTAWTMKNNSALKSPGLPDSEVEEERRAKDRRTMAKQLRSGGGTRKDNEDSPDELQPADLGEGKLKDVTNSTGSRMDAISCSSDHERQQTPDHESIPSSAALPASNTNMVHPASLPADSGPSSIPRLSYPLQDADAHSAKVASGSAADAAGRERRARKSVNYTEPKLNTKMRKPDPPPGSGTKKRASMPTAATPSRDERSFSTAQNTPNRLPLASQPLPTTSIATMKRRKSQHRIVCDDDENESEGTQADVER